MRKTDKKSMGLSFDKSGVILVTIIFIVAMALVFITTALTITIASRQRVYSNAKADQARLTVTSLAQSLWNAIYYQQINDSMLESLAQGTGGSGTLVSFECSEIPGMTGDAATSATAYFYKRASDGKICIECKCEIEGVAQYYTMVLEKHDPEGTPVAMFDLTVDLGDGGQLCRGVFGFDVSGGVDYNNIVAHTAADNVMFLHNPTWSGLGNMGFGSTVITDGMIYFQNACFNRDVYCIGPEAGINFGNSTIERPTGSGQHAGDMYFIGTDFPIRDNGVSRPNADAGYSASNRFSGSIGQHFNDGSVGEIYLEYARDAVTNTYTGYRDFNSTSTVTWGDRNTFRNGMTIHYDTGIFTTDWLDARETYGTFTESSTRAQHSSTMNSYINIQADRLDTIQEIETQPLFAGHTSGGTAIPGGLDDDTGHGTSADPIKAGTYSIGSLTMSGNMYFDVSDGPIFINVTGSLKFNGNSYMIIEGSSNDNKVYIFLHSGATIDIGGGGFSGDTEWGPQFGAGQDNCGIVDLRCFDQDQLYDAGDDVIDSGDWDIPNMDQADDRIPRCIIFSMYGSATNKYALYITGNGPAYLTAFLAFYYDDVNGNGLPDDTGTGSPAWFGIRSAPSGTQRHRLYGRISAGGIYVPSGGYFYLPYCPSIKNDDDVRESAYRDNTDYSVVMDECYYFTQYTGTGA